MHASLLALALFAVIPLSADPTPAVPPVTPVAVARANSENERLLERYYAAVSRGAPAELDELLAVDFRHDAIFAGRHAPDRDGLKAFLSTLLTAFPDGSIEPVEFISSGDTTVCRYRFTGTHQGKFYNLRPTRRAAAAEGIDVWRFRDGRITKLSGVFDSLGLLVRLGLVPEIK